MADKVRISNRLKSLLEGYYPQVLEWFEDLSTPIVCDFLLRWPTLDLARQASSESLEEFFRTHNSNRKDVVERRMKSIRESQELVTDRAVIESSAMMAGALVQQMKTTLEAIREFDRQIEELCGSHQEQEIFASLPGAGPVSVSRLVAAFGSNREKFSSADEVACLSGIAPVIERSGKSSWVRWRYFCPKFLRQTFHEHAGESIRHSFWAKAYYESQRAKGELPPENWTRP